MKKLKCFLFVAAVAFALVGCRKTVDVSFSVASQEIEAQGGTYEVNLTSNGEWIIDNTPEWLTVEPLSGTGNATLTLVAEANTSPESRTCQITATTKDKTATMTVTQIATEYYLTVSPKEIVCGNTGGEYTVEVTSNVEWSVSVPQWITSSVTSGSNNATVTLTVNPFIGDVAGSREADVIFSHLVGSEGDIALSDQVHVVQSDHPVLEIMVTPQELDFVCTGETKTLAVTTDDHWTASVEESWVTLSQTEGQGNVQVSVTVGENPIYVQRQASIIFSTAGGRSAHVTVRQEASPDPHFLEVWPTLVEFGKEGGERAITIDCDTDWEIFTSDHWVMVTPEFGTGNAMVVLEVDPNTIEVPRTAYVSVKSRELVEEIIVNQEAGDEPLAASFTPETITVDYTGGLIHASLVSNTSWQLQTSDWITLVNTTNGQGDGTFDIAVDYNSSEEERRGYVNALHFGQVIGTVEVIQEGRPNILETNFTEIEARPEGGEYVVEVTANQSWTLDVGANWLHCDPMSGFHNGTFTITVDPLSSVHPRTGLIKVSGSLGASVTITVNQHQ